MSGNNPDSRALGVTRGLRECTTTTRKPRPTNRCRGDDEDAQVRERPILPESHSSRLFEILTEPVPHLEELVLAMAGCGGQASNVAPALRFNVSMYGPGYEPTTHVPVYNVVDQVNGVARQRNTNCPELVIYSLLHKIARLMTCQNGSSAMSAVNW